MSYLEEEKYGHLYRKTYQAKGDCCLCGDQADFVFSTSRKEGFVYIKCLECSSVYLDPFDLDGSLTWPTELRNGGWSPIPGTNTHVSYPDSVISTLEEIVNAGYEDCIAGIRWLEQAVFIYCDLSANEFGEQLDKSGLWPLLKERFRTVYISKIEEENIWKREMVDRFKMPRGSVVTLYRAYHDIPPEEILQMFSDHLKSVKMGIILEDLTLVGRLP